MKTHLNTLFVTTEGAYLAKDGQAVAVRVEKETLLRVPLHNLDGIVCFGRVGCSPVLMGACGEAGVAISFLTERGKFLAAVRGFTSGNVLLRREQYRAADDPTRSCELARCMVLGKLANARTVLLRAARDSPRPAAAEALQGPARRLSGRIVEVQAAGNLEAVRGLEGESAVQYFSAINDLLAVEDPAMAFARRSRRPPLDPINALLSFIYTLLMHDVRSACEATGLDPAVGFLHRDRPGRPSLALDLMEEFRPWLADRLALSLLNRRQLSSDDFKLLESGAVQLSDTARKTVLVAWQTRKQEVITHALLQEKMSIGLLVHVQARLLARCLRGDLDAYPPFLWK